MSECDSLSGQQDEKKTKEKQTVYRSAHLSKILFKGTINAWSFHLHVSINSLDASEYLHQSSFNVTMERGKLVLGNLKSKHSWSFRLRGTRHVHVRSTVMLPLGNRDSICSLCINQWPGCCRLSWVITASSVRLLLAVCFRWKHFYSLTQSSVTL